MRLFSKENRVDSIYVLTSQALIILSSIFRALVLPIFFSIESFAHWQTYLLYSAYVGLFTLGFVDGIYLRYGDKDYFELPFVELRSSIRIFLIIIMSFTLLCIVYLVMDGVYAADFLPKSLAAMNITIMGLHGLLMFLLQTTNQLRRYGVFSAVDKILLFFTVCILLLTDYRDYRALLICDILYKIFVILLIIWKTKELFFGPVLTIRDSVNQFMKNVSVGSYLLLANILGMVMIGYGRFYTEIYGTSRDFATYSFGISLTAVIIGMVATLSYIFYPKLKRINENNYPGMYTSIDLVLSSLLLSSLIFYFPIYFLIIEYYEKYHEILAYLNIVITCAYLQSKISVVYNTFYKVKKEQKSLFYLNTGLVLVLAAVIAIYNTEEINVQTIVWITFFILLGRVAISEIHISGILRKRISPWLIIEVFILLSFIVSTSYMNLGSALAFFMTMLGFWFIIRKRDLIETFNSV